MSSVVMESLEQCLADRYLLLTYVEAQIAWDLRPVGEAEEESRERYQLRQRLNLTRHAVEQVRNRQDE